MAGPPAHPGRAQPGQGPHFVRSVREEIEPGTSAPFLMSSDAVLGRVEEAFEGMFAGGRPQLIHTSVSHEQEAALRHVFGG